jgi:hypothetical protein
MIWQLIPESKYMAALKSLPPATQTAQGFLFGEAASLFFTFQSRRTCAVDCEHVDCPSRPLIVVDYPRLPPLAFACRRSIRLSLPGRFPPAD